MRRASVVVIAACLLAAAPAGATLQASLDASGLTLTDTAGTPDDVTISTNKVGLFVTVADKADSLAPACLLVSDKLHGFNCDNVPLVTVAAGAGNDRIDASRTATPLQADLGPGSDV